MTILRLINIVKRFGDFRLYIEDLSFRDGEITCITGPNGSGKSTLLMIIAGIIQPDRGVIMLDEDNITNTPADKRRFPLIRGEHSVPEHLAVKSFLKIIRKVPPSSMDRTIKLLGIDRFMDRKIKELSSGWKIRVGIAASLISNPIFILVDEAFEHLDSGFIKCCIKDLLNYIIKNSIGLIVVSHRFKCCNRVITLNNGVIESVRSEDLQMEQCY